MLEELSSDTGLLVSDVIFRPGINIVLGKYSGKKQDTGINGIGKSTLVRLIDYVLLSERADHVFSKPNYEFLRKDQHTVTLKLKLNGRSCYIRRSFGKDKSIVHFGHVGTTMVPYSIAELRSVLLTSFFPISNQSVTYEGDKFRTLMNFFIKDDLEHQRRDDPMDFFPYNIGKSEKIAYNFFLLGLPNKSQLAYNNKIKKYNDIYTNVKSLKQRIERETGKAIEEFESERAIIQSRIDILEVSLKDFKFLDFYKETESQLSEITQKINNKLKVFYSLNRKIKQIRSFSLTDTISSRVDIAGLYNELQVVFGNTVKKTLQDIIEFRGNLVENRIRYNQHREKAISTEISQVEKDISTLEQLRSALLKHLDEKGELDVVSNVYETLVVEKTALAGHVQLLNEIDKLKEDLQQIDLTIAEDKIEIAREIRDATSTVNDLRTLFREIIDNAIFLNESHDGAAFFDISHWPTSARKQLPFKVTIELPKDSAQGRFMFKLIAYDLMVFLHSVRSERVLPRFLIHDGVFHGPSKRTMTDTLNFIHQQSLRYPNFQYIATFNEDEIFMPQERETLDGKFIFAIDEAVIAEYTDKPEGMIFKRLLD